jgi:hypothetical protein
VHFRRRAHCGSLAADAAVCPKVRYNYTSSRLEVHARLDKVQLRKLCPAFDIKLVQERPHLARSSTYQAQNLADYQTILQFSRNTLFKSTGGFTWWVFSIWFHPPRLNNLYVFSNFEKGKSLWTNNFVLLNFEQFFQHSI